jgi:hypothetical protein
MPPAIHSTMTVSAVGAIFAAIPPRRGPAARTPAAIAPSVAALAVFRKSRRDQFVFIAYRRSKAPSS